MSTTRYCRPPWRRLVAVVAMLGIVGVPAVAADVTPFVAAVPVVSGPIASTDTNFPMIAEGFDVEPAVPTGYIEEEFFVSGTGNIYEYTPMGIQLVASCPPIAKRGCANLPYTTRMLVRRPKDMREFSGTVIIEPLNPSIGVDVAAVWDRSKSYIVRSGHVFVGWTSKSVVVTALQNWNSTRYASLNWPFVASPDKSANDGVYDGITFDIAAQIGALFKVNGPASPLRGSNVRHVIEAGFSQDGGFAFIQANFFHGLERLPGNWPIYDGYVPGGTGLPRSVNFGLTPAGTLPTNDPRRQMQPRDVPVVQVNTETEIERLFADRRADSDMPNDRYRLWEVPGASHHSNDVLTAQINHAELQKITPAQLAPVGCTHQQFVNGPVQGIPGVVAFNDFPFSFVVNAAFADLLKWIEFDEPPPHATFIEVDTSATPPSIVRDQFGNAKGGLRTPFVDVPITTYVPRDTVAHSTEWSRFCSIFGYNTPFDDGRLHALYKNHQDYVDRVKEEAERLVRQRFWLAPDAPDAVDRAEHAHIP